MTNWEAVKLETAIRIFIWFIIFMTGASVFSFLNVVIYRVPRGLDFISGRSECPSCRHTLAPWQMVPVFNWLYLRGKCHYCKAKISPRYPIYETIGGLLLIFCAKRSALMSQLTVTALLHTLVDFALLCILTVIFAVDAETMEIPNGFVITLFIIGAAMVFVSPEVSFVERLIGIVCASIPLLLITLIKEGAFGGGDIKILGAVGFCLGWKLTLLTLFFSILGGGIWGAGLLALKKTEAKSHFAFGPFICIGCALSYFFGDYILRWYFSFF